MEQTYKTHRKFVILYHVVVFLMILTTIIGAGINLYKSLGSTMLYSASLIFMLSLCAIFLFFFARVFALKAQDRAIKAQEDLRHFVLTGKLLDSAITVQQTVGLRFAQDDEFVELVKKAAAEGLSNEDIKKEIKNWKPDLYRV